MSYLTLQPNRIQRPSLFSNELETFLNQCFSSPECKTEGSSEVSYAPAVDVHENEDAFVITADVPGITKEALEIDIIENTVTIQGQRQNESEEQKGSYRRTERSFGTFKRSFKIPGGFVHDQTKAVFENGVLTLTLPKPELQKPKRIEVLGN